MLGVTEFNDLSDTIVEREAQWQQYNFVQIPVDEVLNDSIFNDKYDETNGVLYTGDNNDDDTVVPELIGDDMIDSSITIIQKMIITRISKDN